MSPTEEIPVAPVVGTGVLNGGIFPDGDNGLVSARDVPIALLDVSTDDLALVRDVLLMDRYCDGSYKFNVDSEGAAELWVFFEGLGFSFCVEFDPDEYADFIETVCEIDCIALGDCEQPDGAILLPLTNDD